MLYLFTKTSYTRVRVRVLDNRWGSFAFNNKVVCLLSFNSKFLYLETVSMYLSEILNYQRRVDSVNNNSRPSCGLKSVGLHAINISLCVKSTYIGSLSY